VHTETAGKVPHIVILTLSAGKLIVSRFIKIYFSEGDPGGQLSREAVHVRYFSSV